MQAITIQQPYAHLIALPDDDNRAKRVENRTWPTGYRGPLAIHAGKGMNYLRHGDKERYPNMAFGAIVAVATLAECFRMDDIAQSASALRRFPWLKGHEHVEGPFCWVLTEVRALKTPYFCAGKQGLWQPSREMGEAINGHPHDAR